MNIQDRISFNLKIAGNTISCHSPELLSKNDAKRKMKRKVTRKKILIKEQNYFSSRSRKNLIQKINSIKDVPQFWCSLSYPIDTNPDKVLWSNQGFACDQARQWKKDIDNLSRRFRIKFPSGWAIWRLEPQRLSGRPHYHLIVQTNTDVSREEFSDFVRKAWSRIVDVDKPEDFETGIDVQEFYGEKSRLFRYISKNEVPKNYRLYKTAWKCANDRWGVIFEKNMNKHEVHEYVLSKGEIQDVIDNIIGSLETEIKELEVKLKQKTTTNAQFEQYRYSIKRKQELQSRIANGGFFT